MTHTTILTDDRARDHHPAAVRLVVHEYGDGESWTRYVVLDAHECLDIYRRLRRAGYSRSTAHGMATCPDWGEYYGGPGRGFQRTPVELRRRVGSRYRVVYQSGGLDV